MTILPRRHVLRVCALALSSLLGVATPLAGAAAPPQGAPIRVALIESLSGSFANTGEAVFRNIAWAMERVNARGGVALPPAAGGARPLMLVRYDSKGTNEEALSALRSAIDGGARFVMQGNSSATAAALIDAINKHNQREPGKRVVFLNYSAVDPALTNEKCSFWHFRFDAHADMRMAALMEVVREDKALQRAYLIGQDYSFGQAVLREARRQLAAQRPDVAIVGDELHAVGRVKDFAPYAVKIKASGAQAVITGNWGNDLTLLVKAAREVGYDGMFYTFYGNALGAPAALGDAGVARWWPWPTGCPICPRRAARPSTVPSASAFPARRTTMCTCACSSWSKRLRRPCSRRAVTIRWPWRARWSMPVCACTARQAPCARKTTSSSRTWWWG